MIQILACTYERREDQLLLANRSCVLSRGVVLHDCDYQRRTIQVALMDWKSNIDKLSEGEIAVMTELEQKGFMLDFKPDVRDRFFVGAGSHGGAAHSLRKAMKKCMACCKIYKHWRVNYGEGEHAATMFERLFNQHLGGTK